jgi:hypothetical protein
MVMGICKAEVLMKMTKLGFPGTTLVNGGVYLAMFVINPSYYDE